jgi:hypothetical protein
LIGDAVAGAIFPLLFFLGAGDRFAFAGRAGVLEEAAIADRGRGRRLLAADSGAESQESADSGERKDQSLN